MAGAIWLDPKRTSVYRFYQFWVRVDDRDVIRYLKYFTFLSAADIQELERQHTERPEQRTAHKALAKAVTDLIHGEQSTQEALRASEILFGGGLDGISESTFNDIVGEVPTKTIEASRLDGPGLALIELLVHSGLSTSKGQARKALEGGGISLNNQRVEDIAKSVSQQDVLFGKHLLLRKGKRNYACVTLA